MTLLIGTFSDREAVLTADGFCKQENPAKCTDNLQKIFPISGFPIAILHHGQNIIGGKKVGVIVCDFVIQNTELIKVSSLEQISKLLIDFLSVEAKRTLSELAHIDTGIGFWITGFGFNENFPGVYEIWWKGQDDAIPTKKDRLLLGGDAKKFIPTSMEKKYSFGIDRKNAKQLVRCHNELYEFAKGMQKNKQKLSLGATSINW